MTQHSASSLLWFWVPVRTVQVGFARVQARSADAAYAFVQDNFIDAGDLVTMELDSLEPTGPPIEESSVS